MCNFYIKCVYVHLSISKLKGKADLQVGRIGMTASVCYPPYRDSTEEREVKNISLL